jgi:FtsP/CotA-like multicopper oxidase with cupredoxin domain
MERWRLVNASASRYHRLSVKGSTMHLIASDQGRLAAPIAVDDLLLTPGQRAEVLVPLGAAANVALRSAGADLFTLAVAGPAASPSLPTHLRDEPALPQAGRARSFVLAMGMGMGGGGTMGGNGNGSGTGSGGFTINGRSFDGARIDTEVAARSAEEWTISNSSMMAHPFHLHVWPMKVVSRSSGAAPDPGWRDTVDVPAGQSVVVRIPFDDFTGTAVYHCHILDHEDQGMMGTIRVA